MPRRASRPAGPRPVLRLTRSKAMIPFIIRRLLWMVVLLFVISLLTFIIFYTLPAADPAALRAGRQPTPELLASIRHTLGLDRPWYIQYLKYLQRLVFHFDFGYSFQNNVSVKSQIFDRLPGHGGTGGRRRHRVADGRHPRRDHLRHQARHVDGPRCHGHRARRDLGPGLLARSRVAVPLLQGPRQVPALRGPGRVSPDRQHLHRPRRGHPGADHAVVRAGRLVRRGLRALPARQPARDHVRGLHPDGAGEGTA